jgi:hypothetical protein
VVSSTQQTKQADGEIYGKLHILNKENGKEETLKIKEKIISFVDLKIYNKLFINKILQDV